MEFFPTPSESMLKRNASSSSVSSPFRRDVATAQIQRMAKCAITHRIERLIHLELEDRFGRVDILKKGCSCGKSHKEWFHGGDGQEGGWVDIRDVIVRWVGFARIAYGEVTD